MWDSQCNNYREIGTQLIFTVFDVTYTSPSLIIPTTWIDVKLITAGSMRVSEVEVQG
jgi:hypothetical protein